MKPAKRQHNRNRNVNIITLLRLMRIQGVIEEFAVDFFDPNTTACENISDVIISGNGLEWEIRTSSCIIDVALPGAMSMRLKGLTSGEAQAY